MGHIRNIQVVMIAFLISVQTARWTDLIAINCPLLHAVHSYI